MNAASRDADTTRTRPVNYLIGIAAVVVFGVLIQTVGKPAWHGAVDSDWVRAQGLSSRSDWIFSATLGRLQRSARPLAAADGEREPAGCGSGRRAARARLRAG